MYAPVTSLQFSSGHTYNNLPEFTATPVPRLVLVQIYRDMRMKFDTRVTFMHINCDTRFRYVMFTLGDTGNELNTRAHSIVYHIIIIY